MLIDIFSVVPSPYQRNLLGALSNREDVILKVHYLENAAPDSPWEKEKLLAWESVLPGSSLGSGRVRCHFNQLPENARASDITIINTPTTALTTQRLLRKDFPGRRFFWGEELLPASKSLKGRLNNILRRPIGRCDCILAIGTRAVTQYRRDFPKTPVENMPYFTDLREFTSIRREHSSATDSITFLFCGQMIPRKGLDTLLRAFDTLITKTKLDARLLLAGRPSDEAPWLAAMSSEARSKVEMIGFVAPRDLPTLFARADVFVLPSRHDGWGVVVNQAIGAGMGVIASDGVGAAVELVEDGINGRIVPAGDVQQLQDALTEVAGNPSLAAQWGAASRNKAVDISPEMGAERMVQIFQNHLAM